MTTGGRKRGVRYLDYLRKTHQNNQYHPHRWHSKNNREIRLTRE